MKSLATMFSKTPDQLEKSSNRFKVALAVVGAVVLILANTLIVTLLNSVVAIVAILAIIALATYVGPVLINKLARWKYESLIADAKKNPIWIMRNTQIKMDKELAMAKEAIAKQDAFISEFKSKAREIIKRTDDPSKRDDWLSRIELYDKRLSQRVEKYRQAVSQKKAYDERVEIATLEWDAFLADERASAAFADMKGDPMDRFMSDEAFKHVTISVESTFAALRLDVIEAEIDLPEPTVKRAIPLEVLK